MANAVGPTEFDTAHNFLQDEQVLAGSGSFVVVVVVVVVVRRP